MRILIYSPAFYPSVGGLETLVDILAREFAGRGHEVRLVSQVPPPPGGARHFPFEVVRRPGARKLLRLVRWCEVYFQPNLSLRGAWPLALTFKPWVVSHNNWYARADGRRGWQDGLKHFLSRFASGVSVSRAVAEHVAAPSAVIPNTYREELFRLMPDVARDRELIFVGRLVSDKGADLLLEALARLRGRGLAPRLTLVGAGPEEAALRRQAEPLGGQVSFVGVLTGEALARRLNGHRVLVVPSRWREPFGIVALEGIACGCVVVGSEGGGLKDAIGPCGVTFPNGDAEALADALSTLCEQPRRLSAHLSHCESHLAKHRPAEVARAYLEVLEGALRRGRKVKRLAAAGTGGA